MENTRTCVPGPLILDLETKKIIAQFKKDKVRPLEILVTNTRFRLTDFIEVFVGCTCLGWPTEKKSVDLQKLFVNWAYSIPFARLNLVNNLPICTLPATWNEFFNNNSFMVEQATSRFRFYKKKLKRKLLDSIVVACDRLLCPSCDLNLNLNLWLFKSTCNLSFDHSKYIHFLLSHRVLIFLPLSYLARS